MTQNTQSKDDIVWLQETMTRFYDGLWEHTHCVDISNTDNPGWMFKFDLRDSKLETMEFDPVFIERSEEDWVRCVVVDRVFTGMGGPLNLTEVLSTFRRWFESNIQDNEDVWSEAWVSQ